MRGILRWKGNPQTEDGYTPIAHELLLMFARAELKATDWNVLVVLLAHSYGQKRKHVVIRTREIAELLGVSRTTVAGALERLTTRGIVRRQPAGKRTDPDVFEINKAWREWSPAVAAPDGVELLVKKIVSRTDEVRTSAVTSSYVSDDEFVSHRGRVGTPQETSSYATEDEPSIHVRAGSLESIKQTNTPLPPSSIEQLSSDTELSVARRIVTEILADYVQADPQWLVEQLVFKMRAPVPGIRRVLAPAAWERAAKAYATKAAGEWVPTGDPLGYLIGMVPSHEHVVSAVVKAAETPEERAARQSAELWAKLETS